MDRTLDFLIAGVQKSGTTALWRFLRQHPEIGLAETKEIHFFDNESIDWKNPTYSALHKNFQTLQDRKVIGEATPIYTYWQPSLERIQTYNAAIKLIICLRCPIERAFSHWRMEVERGTEVLSFGDAIRDGRNRFKNVEAGAGQHRVFSYVERGFYAEQLNRVFSLFPKEQVLLLQQRNLKSNHTEVLDRICAFLNVSKIEVYPANELIFSNECSDVKVMNAADKSYLSDVFRADAESLRKLYGIEHLQTD